MIKQIRWKLLLAVFKIKRFFEAWYGFKDLDYGKRKLSIRTNNIREYETRANSVRKEPDTVAWFEEHAADGAVIYDIGANVGTYALIGASCGAEILAFEPSFQNIYALHGNIHLNSLGEKIRVMPVVLGAENGFARFEITDTTSGASRGFSKNDVAGGYAYPMITLDDAREVFRLPEPQAIKIDVDGAEIDVLTGARGTLRVSSLKSLLIEVDDRNRDKVTALLANEGFSITKETRMDVRTVNYVFNRI